MKTSNTLGWLASILTPLVAPVALAAEDSNVAIENHPWSLRAGGEYGEDSSRGWLESVDYTPNPDTVALWFGESGLHTDSPASSGGTVTTNGRVYLEYGTESVHGGMAFDTTTDQGLRHSNRWTGLIDLASGGWMGGLNFATRQTRFDSIDVSVTEAARLGAFLPTTAQASCSVHDYGYGASASYGTDHWTIAASGTWSNYDSVTCNFDNVVPAALQHLDRNGFQALAGTLLNRAVARAGGEIGTQTRLLKSDAQITGTHHWTRWSLQLGYEHSTDEFSSAATDRYSLTGSVITWPRVTVDLVIGTTVANSTSSPFGGVYVATTL